MANLTLTETLVDRVAAVGYDALPTAAIEVAKHVTLDGLAVMLAGATEPLGVGRISIEYVREMGGAPQASALPNHRGGPCPALRQAQSLVDQRPG